MADANGKGFLGRHSSLVSDSDADRVRGFGVVVKDGGRLELVA